MVRLSAVSWDCDGVPEPEGAVCHLFDRTCYLRAASGRMVPVTDQAAGGMPGGFSVALPQGVSFFSLLALGNKATTRGGIVRFEGGLAVDLRTGRPWGPPARFAVLSAGLKERLQRAGHVLRDRVDDSAPSILPAVDTLDWSPRGVRDGTARLAGLGPGLTPAGDDYLVGLMAGFRVSEGSAANDLAEALAAGIDAALAGTTDVSRCLLEGALRGVFVERLVEFIDVLSCLEKPAGIDRATATLAAYGHSSGAVMGLGLIDALTVVSRRQADPPALAHAHQHNEGDG